MRNIIKIIVIVAGFIAGNVSFAAGRGNSGVRLLYWNIQNGMWSDQQNNYDNFVEFVKSQDPDICVLRRRVNR